MRVLVVDDHEVVRRGVRSLLTQSNYDVCGEAVDGNEALEKARQLKPDVIVMDVSMPALNGLEATRRIRKEVPGSEVLIMSQHDSPAMVREAFKAGARGYVVKSSMGKDLLVALDRVSRHKSFFDPSVTESANQSGQIDATEILQRSAALEKALQESEELYRSTFDLAAVGIAHVSPDGRWLRVNDKLCKIVGYSKEELLKISFQDITHPDDLPADLVETEKVRTGALKTFSMEKRYIRKDGSLVWIHLTVSGARDEGGELKHFISVIEDISARRQSQEALRESQAQLALALQSSSTAMFDWDVIQRRGKWNEQLAAIYGFDPHDEYITADEWRRLFHPEDVERLARENAEILREREEDEFQFEFRTNPADGELKWILSHGRIARNATGKALRMIGTHTDITAQKQSEKATSLLAAIVDCSDDAIVSKNLDGIITSWNKSAERLFGYTAGEAIGQPVTMIIPPYRRGEETEFLARLRAGQRIEHFDTVRQRKDGSFLDVSLTISPLRDSTGRVVGASKVARDVTERKRIEQTLAERARLLDLSSDAIMVRDAADRVTYWNKSASDLYGYSREEALGRVTHELLRTEFSQPLKRIMEELRHNKRWAGELIHARKDGSQIIVATHWVLVEDSSGNQRCVLETNKDITQQKQSEKTLRESEQRFRALSETLDAEVRTRTKELEDRNADVLRYSKQIRELSWRLLRTQDQERRHIARELHDSAGQLLAALQMNLIPLEAEAHKLSSPSVIHQSINLVEQLSKELRTVSYLLHPPLLDEAGLSSAIRWYVEGFAKRSTIDVQLEISPDLGRLPQDMEMTIFRIVQESLTNIHRHSGSKNANIRLIHSPEEFRLEIQDSGKGIPVSNNGGSSSEGARVGVGIQGMRERIMQLGGHFEINSNGSGTIVTACLPMRTLTEGAAGAPVAQNRA
jgi:PAS domain S-box-containing protein